MPYKVFKKISVYKMQIDAKGRNVDDKIYASIPMLILRHIFLDSYRHIYIWLQPHTKMVRSRILKTEDPKN